MITETASTGNTSKRLIRKGDVLSADGENEFEGVSAYKWLIDLGATHSMTLYRSNYISFTRGSLTIIVANGETTIAEGYRDILVDLPTTSFIPKLMVLKNV
jgi:hypothetical protein